MTAKPTPPENEAEPAESADAQDPNGNLELVLAERDKYLDLARRTRAELENYQKRVAREFDNERKYAALPLIADLLPALDNLDRALESAKGQPDPTGIVAGIEMVHKQILSVFDKHGIARQAPVDVAFDPNVHEAVMQQPSDKPAMTVLQTMEKGYMFHDRVIRPARVIVAKGQS